MIHALPSTHYDIIRLPTRTCSACGSYLPEPARHETGRWRDLPGSAPRTSPRAQGLQLRESAQRSYSKEAISLFHLPRVARQYMIFPTRHGSSIAAVKQLNNHLNFIILKFCIRVAIATLALYVSFPQPAISSCVAHVQNSI